MARVTTRAPYNVRCSYSAKQLVSEAGMREKMCLEHIIHERWNLKDDHKGLSWSPTRVTDDSQTTRPSGDADRDRMSTGLNWRTLNESVAWNQCLRRRTGSCRPTVAVVVSHLMSTLGISLRLYCFFGSTRLERIKVRPVYLRGSQADSTYASSRQRLHST